MCNVNHKKLDSNAPRPCYPPPAPREQETSITEYDKTGRELINNVLHLLENPHSEEDFERIKNEMHLFLNKTHQQNSSNSKVYSIDIDDYKEFKDILKHLQRNNTHFINELTRLEYQVNQLKQKTFWKNEHGDEYWIYQGDETDNIDTLTCPIIIGREDLKTIKADAIDEALAEVSSVGDYYSYTNLQNYAKQLREQIK